jgi:hypothetical protein
VLYLQWTQLTTRRKNLVRLFEKMQNHLGEISFDDEGNHTDKNIRPLTEADLDRYGKFVLFSCNTLSFLRNNDL